MSNTLSAAASALTALIPNSVLVEVQSGQNIAAIAADNGSVVLESDTEDGWYRLQVPLGKTADRFIKQLTADARILTVDTDQPVNAPEAGGAGVDGDPIHLPFDRTMSSTTTYLSISSGDPINLDAYRQVDLGGITAAYNGSGVVVAVLDTGVMSTHPNLSANLLPGYNALDPKSAPEDLADGVDNGAWGHGTMVAGVIARIAPGAKILPVRVLDGDGRGSVLSVAKGVRYAVSHGARVLNLSLGTVKPNGVLTQALRRATAAGVVVVAAAGNDGTETAQYPAGLTNVISVAAVDAVDQKAVFSNYGTTVSLAAPGVGIRSTFADGGYASWSGTSFAAPFVSAAAALTLSAQPSLSGPKLTQRLLTTGRSIDATNPAYTGKLGQGMLDITRAVRGDIPSATRSETLK